MSRIMVSFEKFKNWVARNEQTVPLDFCTCQWLGKDKSILFLIYRLIAFVWFLETLITNILDMRSTLKYWPIYYTHWSFVIATAQTTFAVVLVSMNQANAYNADGSYKQNITCTIYESLFAAALTQAVSVTFLFWLFALNNLAETEPLTLENIQIHALNSFWMLLDFCLVAFPIRVVMILSPVSISLGYLLFTYVYYIYDGKGVEGERYIYKNLNWNKLPPTISVIMIVSVTVISLFFVFWLLSLVRKSLSDRFAKKYSMVYDNPLDH